MAPWKIPISAETEYASPLCIVFIATVFSGVFDSSYEQYDVIQQSRSLQSYNDMWTYVMILFILITITNIIRSVNLERKRHITTLDLYFSFVLNMFASLQLVSHLLNYIAHVNPVDNKVFILKTLQIENWSSLMFLAWSWACSRHVRRGW